MRQMFGSNFAQPSKPLHLSMLYLSQVLYFDYWYGFLLYIL